MEGAGMRKLSTWLVVGLTAGAFAAGLTGGAFVVGGGSSGHHNSVGSTPPSSGPATVPRTATATVRAVAHGRTRRTARSAPVVARVVHRAPPPPAAVPPPQRPRAVPTPTPTPEANPVAVGLAPGAGSAPVVSPAPGQAVAPPAAAAGGSGEPVEVEPSAGRAGIGAAFSELEAAAAHSGKAVHNVVEELCLEMSASLPSAEGEAEQLPFSCEVNESGSAIQAP
jgi:hypothetical protein